MLYWLPLFIVCKWTNHELPRFKDKTDTWHNKRAHPIRIIRASFIPWRLARLINLLHLFVCLPSGIDPAKAVYFDFPCQSKFVWRDYRWKFN